MSQHNKPRTNLKPYYKADNHTRPQKRSLILRFIIFMAWVIGLGLLLSLVACQPNSPKTLIAKEVEK